MEQNDETEYEDNQKSLKFKLRRITTNNWHKSKMQSNYTAANIQKTKNELASSIDLSKQLKTMPMIIEAEEEKEDQIFLTS